MTFTTSTSRPLLLTATFVSLVCGGADLPAASDDWRTAPPGTVKLAGAMGEKFDLSVKGNFMKLDITNDFFKPFVARAANGGFIGLGKLADAAVHYAKHMNDPEVIARKEAIIGFIIANQLPDGYTGYFNSDARLKQHWDIHEMGFIIQGLVADWELFGNAAALEAAKRNAAYIMDSWSEMPDNWEISRLTDRETTLGFGFGLARLYAATKDERYRSFLRHERALDTWNDPIVIGRDKMIYGQAYGYTGTCLEQLELHTYDRQPRYRETSLRALAFQTQGDGLLIDGNGGICECWTNDQDGEGCVGETCNATFELLFWDELLRQNVADAALLGDLMERAILNALFAAMSADGRHLRYYTPLNGERKFWRDDLYCCPNNFRRAMSRLPEYVFYTKEKAILANLYTACSAELDIGGAKIRVTETTDYPKSGKVKFVLDVAQPTFCSFRLRLPRWCKSPTTKINGQTVPYKCKAGEILALPKVWRAGDTIELDCPMSVRTVRGRKRQSGRFAVMRGPVVYALDTHTIPAFKTIPAYEAQTIMMMDPTRLTYANGTISAVVSTVEWAVGIADVSVDRASADNNVCKVLLRPFCDENVNLTYFRAPNIEADCREDDELFGPAVPAPRLPVSTPPQP